MDSEEGVYVCAKQLGREEARAEVCAGRKLPGIGELRARGLCLEPIDRSINAALNRIDPPIPADNSGGERVIRGRPEVSGSIDRSWGRGC